MNIFILDQNPWHAARAHCDKHVPKMILESAQMLSTVLGGPYKPTHKNHPCTLWVAESRANAQWLWSLADGLNEEYKRRWGHTKNHKSWDVIASLEPALHSTLPDEYMTPFAQAMPDEYRNDNAVNAYRAYYRSKSFASWNRGVTPDWW